MVMLLPAIGLIEAGAAPRTTIPPTVAPPLDPPGAGAGAGAGADTDAAGDGAVDELLFPQALKEIVSAAAAQAVKKPRISDPPTM
jgi:hypothetical protein